MGDMNCMQVNIVKSTRVAKVNCSLDLVNKGLAEKLLQGGLIRKLIDVATMFLDYITKINQT